MILNKIRLQTLPTRRVQCGEEPYSLCVKKELSQITKDTYNCTLFPILNQNGAKQNCSNEQTISIIKTWTSALRAKDFGKCKNILPCNQVIFSSNIQKQSDVGMPKKEDKIPPYLGPHPPGSGLPGSGLPGSHPDGPGLPGSHPEGSGPPPGDVKGSLYITFQNSLVKVIEDHYKHSFISIFSEIGGSLGVMIGMSCMTLVEYVLTLHRKIFLKTKQVLDTNQVQPKNSAGPELITVLE